METAPNVLMKNAAGTMEQVTVELGVDNDNFVEIKSGLNENDTVYVKVENDASTTSGLASLFSSLTGGTSTQSTTATMPGGANMPSDMGNFPGGGPGGNFGGR